MQLFCKHSYKDIIEQEESSGKYLYFDDIIIGTVYFSDYICNKQICVKCNKNKII